MKLNENQVLLIKAQARKYIEREFLPMREKELENVEDRLINGWISACGDLELNKDELQIAQDIFFDEVLLHSKTILSQLNKLHEFSHRSASRQ